MCCGARLFRWRSPRCPPARRRLRSPVTTISDMTISPVVITLPRRALFRRPSAIAPWRGVSSDALGSQSNAGRQWRHRGGLSLSHAERNGVAVGSGSAVFGADGTAVGGNAFSNSNGTAVGSNTLTDGNGTAVGASANAGHAGSGGTTNAGTTAIGDSAQAGATRWARPTPRLWGRPRWPMPPTRRRSDKRQVPAALSAMPARQHSARGRRPGRPQRVRRTPPRSGKTHAPTKRMRPRSARARQPA